jgi:hypothetical protein
MGIGSCTFKGKSIGMSFYIYSGSYWFSYPSFHGRHICITFSNISCYCRLGIKTLNPLKGRLMWFSFWRGNQCTLECTSISISLNFGKWSTSPFLAFKKFSEFNQIASLKPSKTLETWWHFFKCFNCFVYKACNSNLDCSWAEIFVILCS